MRRIIIYILVCVAFFSCNEKIDPIESITEEPVFYLEGSADGHSIDIQAGENDYYLYTSNGQDEHDLFEFNATLKQKNCSQCGDAFQIIVKDYKKSTPANVNIDEALGQLNYQYHSLQNALPYRVYKFDIDPMTDPDGKFTWDFGDGFTSHSSSTYHQYADDGYYMVKLKADYDGCEYEVSKSVYISNTVLPAIDFYYFINSPNTIQFVFKGDTTNPTTSVVWDFGDGNTGSGYFPGHTYAGGIGRERLVRLSVIPNGRDTVVISRRISYPESCIANFDQQQGAVPPPDVMDFSKVIIRWTDENGVEYSSEDKDQPLWSRFSISEIESYQSNEKGEKTKKFKVVFDCAVWARGVMKELRNMEGVIAVSYP